MSNQELFRLWAEAKTKVTTASSIGIDYLKTIVQSGGKGDPSWLIAWVTDFHSYMSPEEEERLRYVYIPNSAGKFTEREIRRTESRFWKRLGHRRGLFESEAIRFRRALR